MKHWMLVLLVVSQVGLVWGQTIYQKKGPDGRTIYSDQPFSGSKAVNLPADNVSAPVAVPDPGTFQVNDGKVFTYDKFTIVFPENEGSAVANTGSFAMQVAAEPALQVALGHGVTISVNGKPVPGTFSSTQITVPAEAFGLTGDDDEEQNQRFTLGASIVDKTGNVLKAAAPVSFYLRHAHIRKRVK